MFRQRSIAAIKKSLGYHLTFSPFIRTTGASRFLHLHEYQSKELLRKHGLNVQSGGVANSAIEAFNVAESLAKRGVTEFVVKCQVLAGGRGKGTLSSGLQGGVKICGSPEEVKNMAQQMIGYRLVTPQTTTEGESVKQVLVLESVDILNELYLAVLLDPTVGGVVIVASRMGGVDIEEVARKHPSEVVKIHIKDPSKITRAETMRVATALGLVGTRNSFPLNVLDQIERLFDFFVETDATTVEVNPLAVTSKSTDHLCVDAKLNFDDNAAYRQTDIAKMEDRSVLDKREAAAQEAGLSFVPMDGNIGCLVNGAGLAMATMDIVKLHGGEPANFLDVGGGANVEQVIKAFDIIQMDKNVKVIFVNIFGGIMRCDIIAEGLLKAVKATNLMLPLIVRLVGNKVDVGKQLLQQSGIKVIVVDDLELAAEAACLASK